MNLLSNVPALRHLSFGCVFFLFIVQVAAGSASNASAGEAVLQGPSYDQVLTCAVYYRMIAGQLRQSQSASLATGAIEKMEILMAQSRKIGEFEGLTTADYDKNWSIKVTALTDQINRNYANIRQLKVRHAKPCAALLN